MVDAIIYDVYLTGLTLWHFIITAHASLGRYVLILTGGLATWTALIIVSQWWISAQHPQSLLTRVRKQVVHITWVMPCTLLGIYTAIRYRICISTLKPIALEPAVQAWAPYWTNKKINVHSDNQTAVALNNRRSCRHPIVMTSFRRILWLSVQYNFRLEAIYYPGHRNMLADYVSRLHEPDGFQRLVCFQSLRGGLCSIAFFRQRSFAIFESNLRRFNSKGLPHT